MFTPLFIVSACTLLGYADASAIPMWELLSREEKLSYLYSMFAYQVEEFCEFSEMPNCNQDLLKHGLNTLKAISEDRLDAMDPYQRSASSIIWNSIMEGHTMKKVKVVSSTTPKPNSYEDDLSIDDLGSQGLASAKMDNVYKVLPPKGFIYAAPKSSSHNIQSDLPEYRQPSNHLRSEDILYSNLVVPLTGPMVVRVHLDGTPVNDGADRIPQDEDLKQYKLSQMRLPVF